MGGVGRVKLTNDIRRHRLATSGGRPVEGLVRVRGLDLRVAGRGVVFERQDPIAVVLTADGGESRFDLPRSRSPQTLAMLAVPAAAFVAARLLKPKRSK